MRKQQKQYYVDADTSANDCWFGLYGVLQIKMRRFRQRPMCGTRKVTACQDAELCRLVTACPLLLPNGGVELLDTPSPSIAFARWVQMFLNLCTHSLLLGKQEQGKKRLYV